MAIAAKISATELYDQVRDRFVGKYMEARLISAAGTVYTPGQNTDDSLFLGFEVPTGQGGYKRATIAFTEADVLTYSDDGVALATKATIFAQDGSATSIDFSHVALTWSSGNLSTLDTPTVRPGSTDCVDGTYTNVPVDSTDGSGRDATLNITISGGGGLIEAEVQNAGSGYEAGDTVTILNGTLLGIAAITGGSSDLSYVIPAVSSNPDAGNIVSVAQTSSEVNLNNGNEAVFYWNLKQFGYYSTSASA